MKPTTYLVLAMTSFMAINASAKNSIFDKGYWLSPASIVKDFTLLRMKPEINQLSKHIKKINSSLSKKETDAIATDILEVCDCFKIDPWLFTGLIQKESSFRQEVSSPTGAVGLTQFTSLGLKEVNDQLGMRGRKGAHFKSISYFNSKIKECVDPTWTHLWDKVSVKQDDPEFYNALKTEIKNDIRVAITYGAVLLKTYVARVDDRAEDKKIKMQKSEIYYDALQIYNGEEGDAKVNYAKKVFKNMNQVYPKDLNFPFLNN